MGKEKWANWCTLYTDASFAGTEKAGWGIWLRHGKPPERVQDWGSCAGVYDNNVAEMVAIIRGVETALATWPELEGIGVKSDSRAALSWAKFGAPLHRRDDIRHLQTYLRKILGDRGCWIKCTWVRGHQWTGSTQGWLNNAVDGLSRKTTTLGESCYPRLLEDRPVAPVVDRNQRFAPPAEEPVPLDIPGDPYVASPDGSLRLVFF